MKSVSLTVVVRVLVPEGTDAGGLCLFVPTEQIKPQALARGKYLDVAEAVVEDYETVRVEDNA